MAKTVIEKQSQWMDGWTDGWQGRQNGFNRQVNVTDFETEIDHNLNNALIHSLSFLSLTMFP